MVNPAVLEVNADDGADQVLRRVLDVLRRHHVILPPSTSSSAPAAAAAAASDGQ